MCDYINGRSIGQHVCLFGNGVLVDTTGDGVPDQDWSEILGTADFYADGDCAHVPGMHLIDEAKLRQDRLVSDGLEIVESLYGKNSALTQILGEDPEILAIIATESMA